MRRKDREVSDIKEIIQILGTCKTASIAMVDDGIPYVVPLSYGYEILGDQLILYFHSAREGRKIETMKHNNAVCFTIFSEGEPLYAETPCNSGYYYSSIIGNGVVEFLEKKEEKAEALRKMFLHQAGRDVTFTEAQTASVCAFKVVSKDFTAKRKPKA